MAWLAKDKDGTEWMFEYLSPDRYEEQWIPKDYKYGKCDSYIQLPTGSIAKLIGRELTWDDEPVELKE